jgi:N-carbamoylputrescine amidase
MQGHSAANLMPVVAANRIGLESVEPCTENGGQSSSLLFYGSSFMTDGTGAILQAAGREREEILYAEYDLDALAEDRLSWGLFRDRRPECYGRLASEKK